MGKSYKYISIISIFIILLFSIGCSGDDEVVSDNKHESNPPQVNTEQQPKKDTASLNEKTESQELKERLDRYKQEEAKPKVKSTQEKNVEIKQYIDEILPYMKKYKRAQKGIYGTQKSDVRLTKKNQEAVLKANDICKSEINSVSTTEVTKIYKDKLNKMLDLEKEAFSKMVVTLEDNNDINIQKGMKETEKIKTLLKEAGKIEQEISDEYEKIEQSLQ